METIILSAIRLSDKQVVVDLQPQSRHHNIIRQLAEMGFETPIKGEQGFITSTGRFVTRHQAKNIALKNGQIKKTIAYRLTSEDLW